LEPLSQDFVLHSYKQLANQNTPLGAAARELAHGAESRAQIIFVAGDGRGGIGHALLVQVLGEDGGRTAQALVLQLTSVGAWLECNDTQLLVVSFSDGAVKKPAAEYGFDGQQLTLKAVCPGNVSKIANAEEAWQQPHKALLSAIVASLEANGSIRATPWSSA
jgi:hypothetical protein